VTAAGRRLALAAVAPALAVTLAGWPGPLPARGKTPAIAIAASRATVRQGETIRLTIQTAEDPKAITLRFAGRVWPLYAAGPRAWLTIAGTDPTMAVGKLGAVAEATAPSGLIVRARKDLTVTKVAFPARRITFDPEVSRLVTPEAVARERRAVQDALRVLHPERLWEDPMLLPVEGRISSPYGVLSIYQGRVSGFHGGADIAADAGTPVRAAGRGIVRLAEALPLSGNAVMIDHGWGVVTAYMHMQEIHVQVGQRIERGEILGLVGSTGLATGPHLHWGLRVNGVNVDPLPWTMGGGP
jgi:murein DD-endopeptidase MepM/ murein hydrolase activator NlpD